MQIGVATVESSMELPQKVKNGTDLQLSNFTSENLPEETWNTNSKEYIHPYVHYNIIYSCQDLEAAQVSISQWNNYGTFRPGVSNSFLLGDTSALQLPSKGLNNFRTV